MGSRFVLEVIRGAYRRFSNGERKILDSKKTLWIPEIGLKLVPEDKQLIIEPQDQRTTSQYPVYIKEMLERAYTNLREFRFNRRNDFYPNPSLNGRFFRNSILWEALQRSCKRLSPYEEKQLQDNPLSDDLLKEMISSGFLKVRSSDFMEEEKGLCIPRGFEYGLNSGRRIKGADVVIASNQSNREYEETLVHEVIEAYIMKIFGTNCHHSVGHKLVNELERELVEFGFSKTIEKMLKRVC